MADRRHASGRNDRQDAPGDREPAGDRGRRGRHPSHPRGPRQRRPDRDRRHRRAVRPSPHPPRRGLGRRPARHDRRLRGDPRHRPIDPPRRPVRAPRSARRGHRPPAARDGLRRQHGPDDIRLGRSAGDAAVHAGRDVPGVAEPVRAGRLLDAADARGRDPDGDGCARATVGARARLDRHRSRRRPCLLGGDGRVRSVRRRRRRRGGRPRLRPDPAGSRDPRHRPAPDPPRRRSGRDDDRGPRAGRPGRAGVRLLPRCCTRPSGPCSRPASGSSTATSS